MVQLQSLMPIVLKRKQLTVKQRRAELAAPLRFITSPKLTAILSGTLATLLTKDPRIGKKVLTGTKAFFAAGFTAGALESPTIRKLLRTKVLRPERGGQFIAGLVEDPTRGEKRPFGERIKEALTTGGLIGAAGLGVVALAGAAKRIARRAERAREEIPQAIEKIQEARIPKPRAPIGPALLPAAMAPVISQPLGPAKKPEPEKPKELPVAKLPSINNKIIFKPVIDIRFSRSRKFINQQLLFR